MKLYKIYTECKNRERIVEEVSKYFEGFTVYEAVGYWKKAKENSLVIEIIAEREDLFSEYDYGRVLCNALKEVNNQESILLTEQEITSEFI